MLCRDGLVLASVSSSEALPPELSAVEEKGEERRKGGSSKQMLSGIDLTRARGGGHGGMDIIALWATPLTSYHSWDIEGIWARPMS